MGSRSGRENTQRVTGEPENKFRSRKWMLSCTIQATAILALGFGMLDGDAYAEICVANIVAYSFANAAEYFRRDGGDRGGNEPSDSS